MKRYLLKSGLISLFLSFLTGSQICFAQSAGLGFSSHEVITDQRTMLDLFPHSAYHNNGGFELSFEMAFLPNKLDYFGYIFRVIENGKRNFDLVYNNRDVVSGAAGRSRFKLVIGERYSNIDFAVTPSQLFYHWNHIQLKFEVEKKALVLVVNGQEFRQPNVAFSKGNLYRIIFGICKEANFKASDCSAFKIRNVKIFSGNGMADLKYFWPLDESSGTAAHENVNGTVATIDNAVWMKAEHANWRLESTLHVKGVSSATYDPLKESLYVVSKDTLWTIAGRGFVQTGIGYRGKEFNLLPSNETLFNPYNQHLYNYYIDKTNKNVSVFDFKNRQWQPDPAFSPAIDFWQTNSFFCKADSSLYVVGGYGRMTYKNTVFRYSLARQTWEEIQTGGSFFCPRYLAACGTTDDGSTAYFLGGYGSRTGEQMLNAKNLYDLVKFNVRTRTFQKIYDLKVSGEDFVFANTMVIDEKTRSFSALVYSNQRFNSELRLLRGSLDKPAYQLIGNPIPFSFHDTHSFVKLFYNRTGRQLIAVTMLRSLEHDQDCYYHFYSLLCPPENLASATIRATNHHWLAYLLAGLLLVGGSGGLWWWHRRRAALPAVPAAQGTPAAPLIPEPTMADGKPAVYMFGNLAIHNDSGNDLTGQFTSLVKELFVVMLIYSLRSPRGITPEKLIELLWPDKSEESARNNRSANLSKLKSILNHLNDIRLSKDTGNLRLEIDFEKVYVDYWAFLQLIRHKRSLNNEQIRQLITITQRGAFVAGTDYPWLDQIKTDVANEAIDIYLASLAALQVEKEPEYAIELANAIFVFDALNEDAMTAKCRALSSLGKHSLARSTFEAFNKEFKELYGESFKSDFTAIVSH